jgi:H+/Cl- antiporter ClcA
VLAKIPRMYSPQDRLWIRVNRGLTVISIMIAVALTAGFAVLAVSDVDPTLELVKQFVKL